MAKKIMTLPEMGEGIMEATVIKIHVKVGDVVEEDDIIMEVATDKIDSDVPALFSGKISEIHCAENEAVAIGSPVFTFKIKGDSTADEELVATPKVPQPQEKIQ